MSAVEHPVTEHIHSLLLTTRERNEIRDRETQAVRDERRAQLAKRAELLQHQIENQARARQRAWHAAREGAVIEPVTMSIADRLEQLYEAKRRLTDPRA